jgi:hypothetical protein
MPTKFFFRNRTEIAVVLVLVLCQLAMIRFPRLIPFQAGRVLSITFFSCLILLKILPGFMDKIQLIRVAKRNILGKFLPNIVILSVSFYMIPHLNAVFYEVDRPASLIKLSGYTIGNILPVSDSGGYLSSIYSFLDYGIVHSVSIFRPLGTLYLSVVFLLCGSNLFVFHLFNTMIFILTISMVILHVVRHMGTIAALLSFILLCGYFSGIHGLLMTEVPGGQFGLISLVCIMDGLYERNKKKYFLGFFLLCLAMQIRAGEIFFPLFLLIISAWEFRSGRYRWIRHFLAGVSLISMSYLIMPIQSMFLREKIDVVSNVSAQLYQVFTNSESWNVYYSIDVPTEYASLYQSSKYRHDYVINAIKNDPLTFIKNYGHMVLRHLKTPEKIFFKWYKNISNNYAIILLCFFLLTPVVFSKHRYIILFYRVLILYVLSMIISSPVLMETSLRNHAVTMYLGFSILLLSAITIIKLISVSVSYFLKLKIPDDAFEHQSYNYSNYSNKALYISVVFIMTVVSGPIIVDYLRKPIELPLISKDEKPKAGKKLLLLSPIKSTSVTVYPNDDFEITNPGDIPRKKYANTSKVMRFTAQHPIYTNSYIFNGLNHLNFKYDQMSCPTIIIPVHLLNGHKPQEIDFILCDFEYHAENFSYYFMVDSIRQVILKKN